MLENKVYSFSELRTILTEEKNEFNPKYGKGYSSGTEENQNEKAVKDMTKEASKMGKTDTDTAAKEPDNIQYHRGTTLEYNYNNEHDSEGFKQYKERVKKEVCTSDENEKIYDFIATSLKILDQPEFSGLNFHIKFLVQLAKYLGFYPGNRYSDSKPSFDIAKSMFVEDSAASIHQIRPPYGQIFSRIIDTDFLGCEEMELSGAGRSYLLEKIIEYYAYRFDNMANIRSLEVLKSVFHQ